MIIKHKCSIEWMFLNVIQSRILLKKCHILMFSIFASLKWMHNCYYYFKLKKIIKKDTYWGLKRFILKFEEHLFTDHQFHDHSSSDIISDQTDQDFPQRDADERRMVLGGGERHVTDVWRSLFFLRSSMAEQVQWWRKNDKNPGTNKCFSEAIRWIKLCFFCIFSDVILEYFQQ